MFIQVMTERDAALHRHNAFDLTKIWPHAELPLIEVGELVLKRNPENHFAEVEQSSFPLRKLFRVLVFHPTACFRRGCSLTVMPLAVDWV